MILFPGAGKQQEKPVCQGNYKAKVAKICFLLFIACCLSVFCLPCCGPPPPPPTSEKPKQPPPPARLTPPAIPSPGSKLEAIDRILESMEFGNIAFNTPTSMNLNDTSMIQLVLGVGLPIEELKLEVQAEGEKEGWRIHVSDRMEARLSGPNFAITAITPEVQAVSRKEVTEWKWEVKPKSRGIQKLHLTLAAHLNIDGVSTPRTIRTFDKVIEVNVTLAQRVGAFVGNNWQWLWAAILVPLAGWLWKKRKAQSKQLDEN